MRRHIVSYLFKVRPDPSFGAIPRNRTQHRIARVWVYPLTPNPAVILLNGPSCRVSTRLTSVWSRLCCTIPRTRLVFREGPRFALHARQLARLVAMLGLECCQLTLG